MHQIVKLLIFRQHHPRHQPHPDQRSLFQLQMEEGVQQECRIQNIFQTPKQSTEHCQGRLHVRRVVGKIFPNST